MVAKPSKTKASLPVTRHPLFPVMVGLWFAALFGLGSLAIRPSLIEAFVLKLHIDLVVPAAAPPLGLTARILLALALFVIGGAIGIVLARRIARSKQAPVSVRTMPATASRAFAPAADDEDFERLAAARNAPPANAIPGRRRALAMEEDYTQDYHDIAPIPGGPPQILDLADLGPMQEVGFEDEAAFPQIAAEAVQDFGAPVQHAPFAAPEAHDQDSIAAEPAAEPVATFDPWNRHVQPHVDQEPEPEATREEEPVEAPFASFAEPVDQDRPFGAPTGMQPAYTVPEEAPVPNFAAPPEAFGRISAPEPVVVVELPAVAAPASFAPPVEAPIAFEPEHAPEPELSAAAPADPQIDAPRPMRLGQLPADAAADLRAISVDSLGVVQLAERLAMAISRRREAAAAPVAAAAPAVPEVLAPPPLPTPGPFAGLAPALENVPSPPAFAAPAQPVEPEAPQPVAAVAAPVMPAALRPLSFDDHEHEPLDLVIPPRNFAAPAAPAASFEALLQPAFQALGAIEEPVDPVEDEGDAYGSLLDLKPSASPFVRIDEPEADFAEIEPVVVFPGQGAQPGPFAPPAGPFSAPAPVAVAPVPEPEPIPAGQRFDIPLAPAAPAPRSVDAEETERALKAALATLQRMSGAA